MPIVNQSNVALIITAPSGGGKTTMLKALFERYDLFELSISDTTRKPRDGEEHGREYYFLSEDEMRSKIAAGNYFEYEEVFSGSLYGTTQSELCRIAQLGKIPVFDVNVDGAERLIQHFGMSNVLAVFIAPTDDAVLVQRLINRGTETPESLKKRIDSISLERKRAHEIAGLRKINNNDLAFAENEFLNLVHKYFNF